MCSIDWGALGTWFGSLVVLAGVIVAYVQLRSLNTHSKVINEKEDDVHLSICSGAR
jgi:hypothetical protein